MATRGAIYDINNLDVVGDSYSNYIKMNTDIFVEQVNSLYCSSLNILIEINNIINVVL